MPGFDSISPQFETNGVLPYLWNTLIICVINLTLLSYALEKICFVRLDEKTEKNIDYMCIAYGRIHFELKILTHSIATFI